TPPPPRAPSARSCGGTRPTTTWPPPRDDIRDLGLRPPHKGVQMHRSTSRRGFRHAAVAIGLALLLGVVPGTPSLAGSAGSAGAHGGRPTITSAPWGA